MDEELEDNSIRDIEQSEEHEKKLSKCDENTTVQKHSVLDEVKKVEPGSSSIYLWLMFYYGLGNILPNNAILSDMDYFIKKVSIANYDVFIYQIYDYDLPVSNRCQIIIQSLYSTW